MEDLGAWPQKHFMQLWFFCLGVGIVGSAVGALRRRQRGLPIFRPHFPNAAFEETWRSGGRSLLWAENCAWIAVLPDRLVTGLHFPFHLLLPHRLLAWAGLDNQILFEDVLSAESMRGIGGKYVRITFRSASGPKSFQLSISKRDQFLRILQEMRSRQRDHGN